MNRILISGAGVAGPALAFWLREYGLQATVVERAPALRLGGQTVDVRGLGRDVVRLMQIEEQLLARVTHEKGIRFVDGANHTVAEFPQSKDGFVSEIEILRGELATALFDETSHSADYIFADSITAIDQFRDYVDVSFQHRKKERFDLVVIADGMRSRTREFVFAGGSHINPLGMYSAYFSIPFAESDGAWARWYNAPGQLTMMLRPDNHGTTRAYISFRSEERGLDRLPRAEVFTLLRRIFAGAGWEITRILAAMESSDDFHFEEIGQVKMDRWSKDRVVLLGDAAYCASPISGMGTTLAIVGAYVLAGEIARNATHTLAFEGYEAWMRPYVAKAQKISPLAFAIAAPETRLGIFLSNQLKRWVSQPGVLQFFSKFAPDGKTEKLPVYL